MRPKKFTIPALTNDTNAIAEDQTTTTTTTLTLTSTTAPAAPQQVSLESSGNISTVTFTITGPDPNGVIQSEDISGPSSDTVKTTAYFTDVTKVAVDGAVGTNVEIGYVAANGMVTAAVPVNWRQSPFNMSLFTDITAGTMTYTIEHTPDGPEDSYSNTWSTDAKWFAVDDLDALTVDSKGNLNFPARGIRLRQSAGSVTGTASFWITQGQNG